MFKLRLGTTKDVDKLLEVAERFYNTTEVSALIPFCSYSVVKQIYRSIASGFIIIAEKDGEIVGVLGCDTYIYPYNNDYKGCMESMFWMDSSVRGSFLPVRMMRQAEECALALGCKMFCMASIPTSPPSTKGWYGKLGYKETDVVFMKLIGEM